MPRKLEDVISFDEFIIRAIVTAAYERARQAEQKHSAAVQDVVAYLRANHPHIDISETEVKHILALTRPRDAAQVIRYETLEFSGEQKEQRLRMLLAMPPTYSQASKARRLSSKPMKVIRFGFGAKTVFPRHNRKPLD